MSSLEFQDNAFGPWTIHASEVFLTSPLSFAFVNYKPILPGHVLVCPKRLVARFKDLTSEEVTDLWLMAQRVGREVEGHFGASSLTLAIQDGAAAGQSVPHVHIHVLPRKAGDFERSDEIYDEIDRSSKEYVAEKSRSDGEGAVKVDVREERKPRTAEEMAVEAAELRTLFLTT